MSGSLEASSDSVAPTRAERFFFDNNGYLILPNFLEPKHVNQLKDALDRAVRNRRQPGYRREHPTAYPDDLQGVNSRIFHLLDEDPRFLELMDYPPMMAYVRGLLSPRPHLHATDGIVEVECSAGHGAGWHTDGQDGFRTLGAQIPLLQLKVGYYLSAMSAPNQGNLTLVPGSHKATLEPDQKDLRSSDLFPGTLQICGPPGTAVLFHNAVWHTGGPWMKPNGRRIMLYYAYEHPWMLSWLSRGDIRPHSSTACQQNNENSSTAFISIRRSTTGGKGFSIFDFEFAIECWLATKPGIGPSAFI